MADHQSSSIEIKLKRTDRTYRAGEKVEGVVYMNVYKGWSHNGVTLSAEGVVHLSTVSRGIMGFGAESSKQIHLMKTETELTPAGKFPDGVIELPFEFYMRPLAGQTLCESYHGVYISVIYSIVVNCDRGMMKKALRKDSEFILEIPGGISAETTPPSFSISPSSIENIDKETLANLSKFKVSGKLHKSNYPVNLPFTGEVIIEESSCPIRSLEIQLVRVESIIDGNQVTRESTEIQNIQIGDGNISRGLIVPMYMVFPRLYSCSTVINLQFKIEFEANLVILFSDGYMITENFPIILSRQN